MNNSYNHNNISKNKGKLGSSGKKNYEKPWVNNTKNKGIQSPLPKLTQNNAKKQSNRKNSSDDEHGLIKKLEDLKNKNRTGDSSVKVANKENNENIDERLNKLQNLLKMAKN